MDLVKAQRWLILGAIALTPVFDVAELSNEAGGVANLLLAATPVFVKALKDIAFLSIIFCGVLIVFKSKKIFSNPPLYLFLFVALSALIASFFTMPAVILLAGIRTLLPLVALVLMWRAVDYDLQYKIAITLAGLWIIAFALQLYELFFFPPLLGVNFLGLNGRNPGFFLIPSTMGTFAAISAYYAYLYLPRSLFRSTLLLVVFPLSEFLTASGTGLVAMAILALTIAYFRIREKNFVILGGAAALAAGVVLLPFISHRDDIYTSGTDRIEIFEKHVASSSLIASHTFGMATNTGVTLANTFDVSAVVSDTDQIVADSTLISFMLNFGVLAALLYVLALFSIYSYTVEYFAFLAIVAVFSLTVIIVESFPMSLLLAVNFVYLRYLRSEKFLERRASAPLVTAPTAA